VQRKVLFTVIFKNDNGADFVVRRHKLAHYRDKQIKIAVEINVKGLDSSWCFEYRSNPLLVVDAKGALTNPTYTVGQHIADENVL